MTEAEQGAGTGQETPRRQRLPRKARLAQLMVIAWALIRDEGTDALTLGRLAEAAGVTKPVVYDHFGSRNGLLMALYREFDDRQTRIFDETVAASPETAEARTRAVASSYIRCVVAEGQELPDVLAALSGAPEPAEIKRHCQQAFVDKCAAALTPYARHHPIPAPALWSVLGAADALAAATLTDAITEAEACDELHRLITAILDR